MKRLFSETDHEDNKENKTVPEAAVQAEGRIVELYDLLERHSQLYYEEDAPVISDAEYDALL
ncbi:MAG: hypothetical protein LBQ90_10700, partial [Synergistaceae bacterium]|nr:hypothetical protein [Synergistaceae bacterium]